MKKLYLLPLALGCTVLTYAQRPIIAHNPEVIHGKLIRAADPKHPVQGWRDVKVRDENGIIGKEEQFENDAYTPKPVLPGTPQKDGALQQAAGHDYIYASQTAFDGQTYTSVCPADPTIAVGVTYVVQLINGGSGTYVQAFDKATGAPHGTRFYVDAITGYGGLGDPVILYDNTSHRFIITEFANKKETRSDGLIIAITGEDPMTDTWKSYFFQTSVFPDYPKYAVSGGVLYAKTNDFRGQGYSGASVYGFDLAAMEASASSPTAVRFSMGTANKYYSMCPVNGTGSTAAGGLFAYLNPRSWSGSTKDSIGLIQLTYNSSNPSASTVTQKASLLAADYTIGSGTVPQPAGGEGLDALWNRVMNQPQYRVLSDGTQSMVLAFTVTNGSTAAVRWTELRPSGSSFAIFQQGTYGGSDSYRWLPSINIDADGNIGLAFNRASTSIYPSIYYVGRTRNDASSLGVMNGTETAIVIGTKSSSCRGRYGDYNHLVMDPSGSYTYWFNGMYNKASSWSTYIGSFKISSNSGTITKRSATLPAVKEAVLSPSLYPNPVQDVLTIITGTQTVNGTLQVLDLSGRVLREQKITNPTNKIDVNGLPSGAYLLKVQGRNTISVDKFLKE